MHVGIIFIIVVWTTHCFYNVLQTREKWTSVRQVTLLSLTLEVEKGNFDGSVLQGVWMAVSGGGQTWVISWWRKKPNQQSLETRGTASMWTISSFNALTTQWRPLLHVAFTCISCLHPEALQSNCIYTFILMHLQWDRTETLTYYMRGSVNQNISVLPHF